MTWDPHALHPKSHPNSFTTLQGRRVNLRQRNLETNAIYRSRLPLNALMAGCAQCSYGIYRRDATHIPSVGRGSGWWRQPCCVAGISTLRETRSDADSLESLSCSNFALLAGHIVLQWKPPQIPLNSFKVLAQTDEHRSLVWVTLCRGLK